MSDFYLKKQILPRLYLVPLTFSNSAYLLSFLRYKISENYTKPNDFRLLSSFLFSDELKVVRSSFLLFVSDLVWLDRNLMPGSSPPIVISPISYTVSIVVRTYVGVVGLLYLYALLVALGNAVRVSSDHLGSYIPSQ